MNFFFRNLLSIILCNCENRVVIEGIVSRDGYFLKVLKIKTVLFKWALMVFPYFCWLFVKKPKLKFSIASVKSLTNCESTSSNPLQSACSGFLIAACDSKSCSESRLWLWKLFRKPAMNVHWRKSTNVSEGMPEQNFGATFGTIFSINLIFFFSETKAVKKFTNHSRMNKKYWFHFTGLKNNIHLGRSS